MSTTSSTPSIPPTHDAPTVCLNKGPVVKEVRAYEYARCLTKKRRKYEPVRAYKERLKASGVRVQGYNPKLEHGGKLSRKQSWEEPRSVRDAVSGTPEHAPERDVVQPPRDGTSSLMEVTLGDLVSQPRRLKAKRLDFELIPPIRAVIALDDAEPDEPWEYITRASVNDGSARKGKSYAQAVASAM